MNWIYDRKPKDFRVVWVTTWQQHVCLARFDCGKFVKIDHPIERFSLLVDKHGDCDVMAWAEYYDTIPDEAERRGE